MADEGVAVLPDHLVIIPLSIQVTDDILLALRVEGIFLVPESPCPGQNPSLKPLGSRTSRGVVEGCSLNIGDDLPLQARELDFRLRDVVLGPAWDTATPCVLLP
jgi:hypothetical protein